MALQTRITPGDRILLDINLEQLNSLNHSIDKLTETIAISAVDNPEIVVLPKPTKREGLQRSTPK